MQIALHDPIWSRLYGPYGVQDVKGALDRLSASWDKSVADHLFWERLHHQETLYPVTYAALPWLRQIALQHPEARRDILLFLSWVAFCAVDAERLGPDQFSGLSLDLGMHRQTWLPQEIWLTAADLPVLSALDDWMKSDLPRIIDDCLGEMRGECDRSTATYLAVGPLAIWGGREAARAVVMWNDGEKVDVIREELDLSDADFLALHRLVTMLSGAQGWLRDFADQLDGREPGHRQADVPL
jgi:hypothetical protein